MKLRECMTSGVKSIAADTPLKQAAEEMANADIGILPVVDGNKIIGVVTDRDITCRGVAAGLEVNETPVRSIMSEGLWCIDQEEDIATAIHTLEDKQIRRVFATDPNGQIVGVCSLGDVALRSGDEHLTSEALREVSKPNPASSRA